MKEFITKLRLMWLGAMSVVGICLSLSGSASEYKSIIRYDRVWENKSRYYNDQGLIRCVRFDGPEEINGKIYHRVVTFKKSHWESDINAYVTEDCYEKEGYLREENGVVYALVCEDRNIFGDTILGGTHIPETDEEDEQLSYREHVLYDMTLNEGDRYTAFSELMEDNSGLETFKVLHTSYIDIGGEECRMMYVCTESEEEYMDSDLPYTWFHPIIEGVGIVESGCLNFLTIEGHKNTGMMYWKCFERILDMEGNVLYRGPDYDDRLDALTYGSFVTEVDTVEAAEVTDDSIYDILGRRIANPAPGQLYIQGGKKHIAK
ncbi:MAG: hypothetical protein K2J58_00450 [Muribaculaceae bacterium]|nr:hypothetical protein [Muribaculaceae bacterium]